MYIYIGYMCTYIYIYACVCICLSCVHLAFARAAKAKPALKRKASHWALGLRRRCCRRRKLKISIPCDVERYPRISGFYGLEHDFSIFPEAVGKFIIPADELIFSSEGFLLVYHQPELDRQSSIFPDTMAKICRGPKIVSICFN